MSGALPVVSSKEAVQALQRAGFAVVSRVAAIRSCGMATDAS